ncbi:MAG TPA: hypothetical protein VMT11_16405 [Myxococcaceae bacterium]|nr:hypothetical protein [Myxococcaceae bacterium]
MERTDWEAFFECLDRSDLTRLAKMGVAISGEHGPAFAGLCLEHGVPVEALKTVKGLMQALSESAQTFRTDPGATTSEMHERSLRNRDLVKALDKAIEACLRSVTNLAAFTAKVERLKRAKFGGGSVSSTLFVGERLHDLTVEGTRASAIRRFKGGYEESITFIRRGDTWYIKLLPKPGARPR